MERLSKQDDSWSHAIPMIGRRTCFDSVNGKIFVFGGEDKDMTLNWLKSWIDSNDSFAVEEIDTMKSPVAVSQLQEESSYLREWWFERNFGTRDHGGSLQRSQAEMETFL